jgi:hypothetical protein
MTNGDGVHNVELMSSPVIFMAISVDCGCQRPSEARDEMHAELRLDAVMETYKSDRKMSKYLFCSDVN